MAKWVSQSKTSSASKSARSRVAYLDEVRIKIENVVEKYFQDRPAGEDVTLEVFQALGQKKIIDLGGGMKNFDRTKQDLGRLVALVLVDKFGPNQVLTYREDNERDVSTRAVHRPSLEWVSRYTPHRVLHEKNVRIVLDTNTIRNLIQGAGPKGDPSLLLDLNTLANAKGSHPVSIADPAWAELIAQLARGAIPFGAWSKAIHQINQILDPDLPIVPGGRELAVMSGLINDPAFNFPQMCAYYRAVWTFLTEAKSPESFQQSYTFTTPDGQRQRIGPIDLTRPSEDIKERGAAWRAYLSRVVNIARGARGDSVNLEKSRDLPIFEDIIQLIQAHLSINLPPALVDRLGLYIHVLARHSLRAITKDSEECDQNDAMDLDILYAVVLPAVICTTDKAMRRLARETGASDGNKVMSPSELLTWLNQEESGHVSSHALTSNGSP